MKISLNVGNQVVTATLIDSETTHDFISLLPLTLEMNDLLGREKFGHLPRAISEGGKRARTYHVGDVIYWSPGPDVAIYYRHDGSSIPSPGIIVIAKIDSGVEALDVPGSAKVTMRAYQVRRKAKRVALTRGQPYLFPRSPGPTERRRPTFAPR